MFLLPEQTLREAPIEPKMNERQQQQKRDPTEAMKAMDLVIS